jgi:hypothetical protein
MAKRKSGKGKGKTTKPITFYLNDLNNDVGYVVDRSPPYNPPGDGNCFYHCLAKRLRHSSNLKIQLILQSYDEEFKAVTGKKIYALHSLLRYMTSRVLTEEDLESYLILHEIESIEWFNENLNPTIEEFRNFIAFTNEYANEITINAFLKVFTNAGLGLIIKDEKGSVVSLEEWSNNDKKEIYEMLLVNYGDGSYHYRIYLDDYDKYTHTPNAIHSLRENPDKIDWDMFSKSQCNQLITRNLRK